jgi:alkylation response protein AidB-like acyl-CoA dehydrogenase
VYLSDTRKPVREMTRQFADAIIRPAAVELDREERFPAENYEQMATLGIAAPETMGGLGFDTVTYALVMEELSRGYAAMADQCGWSS